MEWWTNFHNIMTLWHWTLVYSGHVLKTFRGCQEYEIKLLKTLGSLQKCPAVWWPAAIVGPAAVFMANQESNWTGIKQWRWRHIFQELSNKHHGKKNIPIVFHSQPAISPQNSWFFLLTFLLNSKGLETFQPRIQSPGWTPLRPACSAVLQPWACAWASLPLQATANNNNNTWRCSSLNRGLCWCLGCF